MKRSATIELGFLFSGIFAAILYWVAEAALHAYIFNPSSYLSHFIPSDPHEMYMRSAACLVLFIFGAYAFLAQKRLRESHEIEMKLQRELNEALTKILGGFLPICANCKRVRSEGEDPNDQDSWRAIDAYIGRRSDIEFSHGICPICANELYGYDVDQLS